MNILVYCSAQEVSEKYTQAATEIARLVAQRGHALVWGGSNEGTMKVIADAVQNAGGKVVGVSMEFFKHKARPNADEMYFAKDLSERKRMMVEKADAIVVLAGGIGTLDEATEVLALKRHGDHDKPLIFLNTDGFYEGLKMQIERMEKDGFLASKDNDVVPGTLIHFAETPVEAIRLLWLRTPQLPAPSMTYHCN
jgi:uncharacterized protein (TIGR00730 family)